MLRLTGFFTISESRQYFFRLLERTDGNLKKRRVAICVTGITVMGLVLAGCNAGPTYGTGKTSGQQLIDDLSSLASIRSSNSNTEIDTKPRPALVRPAAGASGILPQPQEDVARPGNPDWPESPEARLKRLRDEATANRNNPNYVSPVAGSGESARRYLPSGIDHAHEREDNLPGTNRTKAEREQYKRFKQQNKGGSATYRKYLSEPPLIYRQPAKTAPAGERGEDEAKKERERKARARKGK